MIRRPNILFFFVDDMGVTDTSVPFLFDSDGQPVKTSLNERYRTPNLERVARQGRRLSNTHAYSVCTPTRAALMAGQKAARAHITTWTAPEKVRDTGTFDMEGIR